MQVALEFYQRKRGRWPFATESIPWEVWTLRINVVSLNNEHGEYAYMRVLYTCTIMCLDVVSAVGMKMFTLMNYLRTSDMAGKSRRFPWRTVATYNGHTQPSRLYPFSSKPSRNRPNLWHGLPWCSTFSIQSKFSKLFQTPKLLRCFIYSLTKFFTVNPSVTDVFTGLGHFCTFFLLLELQAI